MRTTFDCRLADPSGFEPGLVADLRDQRRALLFDLGEAVQQLAPRVLLRSTHVFVTHAHMDHFAGFDHLLALALGRVQQLVLWGGPGFCDRVEYKLLSYTWNVVHRYRPPMVIEVHSLEADGSRRHARFASTEGFARRDAAPTPAGDDEPLLDEALFTVRATIVDHEMPVLAFAIDEKPQLRVAGDRVAALGLATGAWLHTLKSAVLAGADDATPIEVAWRDRDGDHQQVRRVGELRPAVLDAVEGRRIGYVTDLCFTPANVGRLQRLLGGVDLLHIEAVFADTEGDHAARKNHLTARQAGEIARALRAKRVVPFHHSPRYRGREQALRDEVWAAWQGDGR